jgi:hypothetical protein
LISYGFARKILLTGTGCHLAELPKADAVLSYIQGFSRVRAAFGFAIAKHSDVRTRFKPNASARSDGLWTKSPIRRDAANGRSGILP